LVALAHVSDTGTQSLEEHLLGVSSLARTRGEKFEMGAPAALLGVLHDLGKASSEFQAYICSFLPQSDRPRHDLRGTIDHSTAGAQVLCRRMNTIVKPAGLVEFIRMLSLCIASHHSGLIDCVGQDGEDLLEKRLNAEERKSHAETSWRLAPASIRAEAERLFTDPDLLTGLQTKVGTILRDSPGGTGFSSDRAQQQIGLLVRLLFSCLIDADRTDTADHERSQSEPQRQHGRYESWDVLLARLKTGLDAFPTMSEIDRCRRQVSEDCFAAAKRPCGGYTLTVPTGGGKTLAALRFAMEHARIHKLDRVIFVAPFISIVDQNAAVVRKILEPDGDFTFASVVLEHHSNLVDDEDLGAGILRKDHWRRRLLTENWDAPVVFTTMAQVLESLFGRGTTPVRRLHALTRSVIVFDEAQTLPIRLIHLFNNAVNLLTAHCGSTVLLCTATQPLLDNEHVDALRGRLKLAARPELIDCQPSLFENLRRYVVHDETRRPGGWSRDQVAELACAQAATHGSCLVIVNTKRDAREIFAECRERLPSAHVVHLSTAMCPAHRMQSLDALRARLQTQKSDSRKYSPILCVSTQLIEAGVDVDFAAVIRDLAGLDSMAQAAGRCNRNGERTNGYVTLVRLPDLPKALDDIRKGREAAERILADWCEKYPGKPFALHAIEPMREYFLQNFFNRRDEMSYSVKGGSANGRVERDTTLLALLGANQTATERARDLEKPIKRLFLRQSFMTAATAFQLIDKTQAIIVPFGDKGKDVLTRILSAHDLDAEWRLLRQAQLYAISVRPGELRRLRDNGAVYTDLDVPGLYFLRSEHYDEDTGLRDEAGTMEVLNV
jgi:CRISPR-associated endonuclease/helicase Cas3